MILFSAHISSSEQTVVILFGRAYKTLGSRKEFGMTRPCRIDRIFGIYKLGRSQLQLFGVHLLIGMMLRSQKDFRTMD